MLSIRNLRVSVGSKTILDNFNLDLPKGEIHVLMGPNGVGKSTLGHVIMGSPSYTHESGQILVDGEDVSALQTQERSRKGIYLAFQNPVAIPGLKLSEYLRNLYHLKHKTEVSVSEFRKIMKEKLERLEIDRGNLSRYLNDGFSGGEKKRFEMLQMLILEPKLAILDEIDSGLDMDAQKIIAECIKYISEKFGTSFLIVTHYSRLFNFINPHKIQIMTDGKISKIGDASLIQTLEKEGFGFVTKGG